MPLRLRLTCPRLPTLCRFHNVVPQEGLPLLTPSQLSQLVVNRAKRTGVSLPWGRLEGWAAAGQPGTCHRGHRGQPGLQLQLLRL